MSTETRPAEPASNTDASKSESGGTELTASLALADYEACLEELAQPAYELTHGSEAYLRTLLARDAVARATAKLTSRDSPAVDRLILIDRRLRQFASSAYREIRLLPFDDWRSACVPPSTSWWWHLDSTLVGNFAGVLIGRVVTAAAFASLIVITLDLFRRFLTGGPDAVSLPYVVLQTVVAIATGTAYTSAGARWLEGALQRRGVARRRLLAVQRLALLASLLVACVIWLNLNRVASLYADSGAELAAKGQLTTALSRLQRAIAIDPEHTSAHYNLGDVYESLGDHDKALQEYQAALRSEGSYIPAYNNAAHILLRKEDFAGALALVDAALIHRPIEASLEYDLWRNRAAAHLGLKHLRQAKEDAMAAKDLLPNRAGARCILAAVLDAENDPAATLEWRACLAQRSGGEHVDEALTSQAEERLR